MDSQAKHDQFYTALRACTRAAWNRENGRPATPHMETPFLIVATCYSEQFSDDELTMASEIHSFLQSPACDHPINLHLFPQLFLLGLPPAKSEMTVVRMENPTVIGVYTVLENYRRSLGCPPTDSQFVGGFIDVDGGVPGEDVRVFMES